MKHFRIILFSLYNFFYFSLDAFTQEHLENFLLKQELITSHQLKLYREELEKDRKYVLLTIKSLRKEDKEYAKKLKEEWEKEEKDRNNNQDTLQLLADIFEKLKKGATGRQLLNEEQISSLRTFSDKLLAARLISKPGADSIIVHLGKGHLQDSFSLVRYGLQVRNKLSSVLPARLVELIDLLLSQGLMDEHTSVMLKQVSLPDSVNRIRYILSHCKNTEISRSLRFFRNEDQFNQVLEDLQKLSGIKLSGVMVSVSDQQTDGVYYKGRPQIEASYEGRKYKYKGNEVLSGVPLEEEKFSLDAEELFNFILASKRSAYRVYRVSEQDPLYYSSRWEGFMLLTASQWEALYHSELLELNLVDHQSALSDEQVKTAIAKYRQLGLFSLVTAAEEENVLDEIRLNPVFRYNELLSRFPSATAVLYEDKMMDEKEVAGLIEKFVTLSNGQLNVTGISFFLEDETQWVSFEANGKKVRASSGEWPHLWNRFHEILITDPTKTLQVDVLRFSPRAVAYLLISRDDHDKLEKEGLIDDY